MVQRPRSLSKIVQRETGKRDLMPGTRDVATTEMAHVGLQRFRARDHEDHGAV